MTKSEGDDLVREEGDKLHRNNAAEWVMVVVLYPAYVVGRLIAFVSSRVGGPRHG